MSPAAYDIDLQLFTGEGRFFDVPPYVNVLPPLQSEALPMDSARAYILAMLRRKRPLSALRRAFWLLWAKITHPGNVSYAKNVAWRAFRRDIGRSPLEYDVAVAYMTRFPVFYVADCVQARRKYAWVHNDVARGTVLPDEGPYLAEMDRVVTVSAQCRASLEAAFPHLRDVLVLPNLGAPDEIRRLSRADIAPDMTEAGLRLVTVGRFVPEKGYDIAVAAAAILAARGVSFHWYFLGEGPERAAIEARAGALGVSGRITFKGAVQNPYPYMARADLIVQPSRHEGKSVALDEAKALERPILATDYATAREQVDDGVTGLIVPMTPEGVADGIARLAGDEALRARFSAALGAMDFTQGEAMAAHEALFAGEDV